MSLSLFRLFRQALMFVATFAVVFTSAGELQSEPRLKVIETIEAKRLPLVKPKWPMPKDAGQVFFIQRSMNRNTVVYRARFDGDGDILSNRPLSAYWRRYAEQGQTRKLKVVENLFAYGISARKNRAQDGWTARFAALPSLSPVLRQEGPFKAALWADIGGREYRMIYGYLDLDESGLVPKVIRLRLFTFDPKKDAYVTHMISVSGGDIK